MAVAVLWGLNCGNGNPSGLLLPLVAGPLLGHKHIMTLIGWTLGMIAGEGRGAAALG